MYRCSIVIHQHRSAPAPYQELQQFESWQCRSVRHRLELIELTVWLSLPVAGAKVDSADVSVGSWSEG